MATSVGLNESDTLQISSWRVRTTTEELRVRRNPLVLKATCNWDFGYVPDPRLRKWILNASLGRVSNTTRFGKTLTAKGLYSSRKVWRSRTWHDSKQRWNDERELALIWKWWNFFFTHADSLTLIRFWVPCARFHDCCALVKSILGKTWCKQRLPVAFL